jgi:hypothetical protein
MKNGYGPKLETWALNGLEEPLKKICIYSTICYELYFVWL